jgi:hypothetical protein
MCDVQDFVVEEDWYQRTYVAVGDVADPSLRQVVCY